MKASDLIDASGVRCEKIVYEDWHGFAEIKMIKKCQMMKTTSIKEPTVKILQGPKIEFSDMSKSNELKFLTCAIKLMKLLF